MSEKYCALFAGQSVQEAGMGKALLKIPAAKAVVDRLKPSLGDDLEALLTTTPDETLALTFNAQRAIHACHVANFLAYKAKHPELRLDGAIGHSMGIVAALVAAEALTVEDSGVFIRARAQAFSDVCKTFPEPMGLAAASTDDFNDVVDTVGEVPGVSVALFNTRTRGTLGGTTAALEAFATKARDEDWPVRVKVLKVEGPYHTSAFLPCKGPLEAAVAKLKISKPKVPVYMGTSGKAESDPAEIGRLLAAQAFSTELHLSAVQAAFAAGSKRFLEVAHKPQPVTWLSDQVDGAEGKAVQTEEI